MPKASNSHSPALDVATKHSPYTQTSASFGGLVPRSLPNRRQPVPPGRQSASDLQRQRDSRRSGGRRQLTWLPPYAPNPRYDGVSRIHWIRVEGENQKGRVHFRIHEDSWSAQRHNGQLRAGLPLRAPENIPVRPTPNPVPSPEWFLITRLRRRTRFNAIPVPSPRGRALSWRQTQSVLERMLWGHPHIGTAELQFTEDYLNHFRLPPVRIPRPVSEHADSHESKTTSMGGSSSQHSDEDTNGNGSMTHRTSMRSSHQPSSTRDQFIDWLQEQKHREHAYASTATSPLAVH